MVVLASYADDLPTTPARRVDIRLGSNFPSLLVASYDTLRDEYVYIWFIPSYNKIRHIYLKMLLMYLMKATFKFAVLSLVSLVRLCSIT